MFVFLFLQWGLLVTFIELIKNPRYAFWRHSFTRCAPEIEKVFESVARSCIGATSSGGGGSTQQQGQVVGGQLSGGNASAMDGSNNNKPGL